MTTGFESETLDALLTQLASVSPVPAGVSAAALVAAIAAALVSKISRIASRHSASSAQLAEIETSVSRLRHRLTALAGEDIAAYEGVLEARRTPAESRGEHFQRAMAHATEVPLELVKCSEHLLDLCEVLVQDTRPSTLGDLGVAVALAWAALEGGVLTARVNLKSLTDSDFVNASGGELDHLIDHGTKLRQRVLEAIVERA